MGGFIVPIGISHSNIDVEVEILGELLNEVVFVDPVEIEIEILGSAVAAVIIVAGPIEVTVSIESTYAIVTTLKGNWVKWSKVGRPDFTIDETNVAGERPMDWPGQVYEIKKLDKQVVVYGSNGISVMVPSGITWGLQTIHRLGIVCKTAVVGNDTEHYCIDLNHKLYHISSQGLELLDYSEYLELMTNPVMSMDINTGIIYICDGTYGYVYSTLSKSFGSGPINVTGVGTRNGTLYVVSDGDIEIPSLHICTDIYDFNIRTPKTIQYIEVGTDLTNSLQAMIETRVSNKDRFHESKWALVNPSGIAYIPCYGVEFKFHLRSFIYEYLELDYIKATGVVHGYNFVNQIG